MPPLTEKPNVDYPALYDGAGRASRDAQIAFLQTIGAQATLSLAAATFATYGAKNSTNAILAAVLFLALIGVSILHVVKRFEKTWYRGRAAAESIKTMTWRYMMKAEPFDENNADTLLRQRLQSVLGEYKELGDVLMQTNGKGDQITDSMRQIRKLGFEDRKELYLLKRIQDQQNWYLDKALWNKLHGRYWFTAMITAQSLALICVLVGIKYPMLLLPTNTFVVAGGTALTWIQVKRFRELAAAYSLTAHEIGIVKSKLTEVRSEREFSEFVGDAENAFSREHTQWIARLDK